jgi:hypothetical protein
VVIITHYHTHWHTHTKTRQDSSGLGIGPSQGPVPDNTQHSQETDNYAPGEIRTRNPSKLTSTDPLIIKSDSYEFVRAGLVAFRFKSLVCSNMIAGIAGSNSPEDIDVRILSLLCVVLVAACATSWSLVQRSPTECICVIVCYLENWNMRGPKMVWAVTPKLTSQQCVTLGDHDRKRLMFLSRLRFYTHINLFAKCDEVLAWEKTSNMVSYYSPRSCRHYNIYVLVSTSHRFILYNRMYYANAGYLDNRLWRESNETRVFIVMVTTITLCC